MADSSSKIFPCEDDNVSNILSSISFNCFLFAALCKIRPWRSSSSSGLKNKENYVVIEHPSVDKELGSYLYKEC